MVYGSRSIKRRRRTKAAMGEIHEAIAVALAEDSPVTVRQCSTAWSVPARSRRQSCNTGPS